MILIMLFVFQYTSANSLFVFAIGDTNIDGGGNNLGNASNGNTKWGDPYAQGVRVSVVNSAGQNMVTPIDITNHASYVKSNVKYHFGKYNKIQYTSGKSLMFPPQESSYSATQYSDLPTIINGNVSAIKLYFSVEDNIKRLADSLNLPYTTLTNGSNKLLIEPIAYVTYIGDLYAVTATESAMFGDMMPVVNSYNMSAYDYHLFSLTRGSLPLAIFLEKSDLGIPSHGGASSGTFSNAYIKSTLGIGIVSFAYDLSVDTLTPETTTPKEMTDIYANVKVSNNTKSSKTADLEILVSGNVVKTQSVTLSENSSKTIKVTGIPIPAGVTARKLTARLNWVNRDTETNANNNYQTVDLSVKANNDYDISVDNINVNITQPKPNDLIIMSGNVTNHSTKSRTMLIEYRISGANVKTENKTIGAGKTITVTASNLTIPQGERDRTLTIRANFDKKEEETNANNNQKSTTITVAEVTNGFDFSADIIKPSATAVIKDGTIDITGTVSYKYGPPKSKVFVELRLSGAVIKSEYVDFVAGQTHTIKATGVKMTMPASKDTRKVAVAVNDAKKGSENDSTNNYKGTDVTITNKPPEPPTEFHGITVWKLDEYGNLLDGASFKIMSLENYMNGSFYGYEDKAYGGIFTVTAPEGTHVVRETVVPPGYIGGSDIWVTSVANSNTVYGIVNYLPDNAVEKMWITDKNGKEPVKCKRGREYTLHVTFKHYGNNIPISVTQDSVVLTDGSNSENKIIGSGTLSSGNNVGYTTKTYKFTVPNYADEDLSFTARINWDKKDEESKPHNNEMIYNKPVYQGDIYGEFVTPNSFYRAGTDIVSSFMMYNTFEYVVEPDEDKLNLNYKAYYIDNSNTKQYFKTSRDIKEKYVLPSRDESYGFGNNLAYIKVSLPKDVYEKSKDKRIYVECEIDKTNTNYEDFEDNNVILGEWYMTPKPTSQTPNTKYEKRKPQGFNPPTLDSVTIDTSEYVLENKQTADWSEWIWSDTAKAIELRKYSMTLDDKVTLKADEQSPSKVAVYSGCTGGSIEKKKCAKHGNDVCTVENKCPHGVIGKHRLPCSHGRTEAHSWNTSSPCSHGYGSSHTVTCSHGYSSSHTMKVVCQHGYSTSHSLPGGTTYCPGGSGTYTCWSGYTCSGGTSTPNSCSGNGGECKGGETSCNDYDDIPKPCKHGSTSSCSDKGEFVKWQLKSGYGTELTTSINQKANFVGCDGGNTQKKYCAKHGSDVCTIKTNCVHNSPGKHQLPCGHGYTTYHTISYNSPCSHGVTYRHQMWCSHGYNSHTQPCSHGNTSSHKTPCYHGKTSPHSYNPSAGIQSWCDSQGSCSGGYYCTGPWCDGGSSGSYGCSGNGGECAGGTPSCNDFDDVVTRCKHGESGVCDVIDVLSAPTQVIKTNEMFTFVQNGNAYFPEFSFDTFNNKYRSLEMTDSKTLSFEVNPFAKDDKGAVNNRRLHFTPLWYPDTDYGVATYSYDLWTPSGMLSKLNVSDKMEIKGNMYGDWYVGN